MAQCFCGCGRKVWLRGRTANVTGEDARRLACELGALGARDVAGPPAEVQLAPGELGDLSARLEFFCAGFREVVHGERRLATMEPPHGDWPATRDRVLAVIVAEGHAIPSGSDAPGEWLTCEGLREDDPELLDRIAELGPDKMEHRLQEYEARRARALEHHEPRPGP